MKYKYIYQSVLLDFYFGIQTCSDLYLTALELKSVSKDRFKQRLLEFLNNYEGQNYVLTEQQKLSEGKIEKSRERVKERDIERQRERGGKRGSY